jgi:hypothetical protein
MFEKAGFWTSAHFLSHSEPPLEFVILVRQTTPPPSFGGRFFKETSETQVASCKIGVANQPILTEVTDVSPRIIVAMDGLCVK